MTAWQITYRPYNGKFPITHITIEADTQQEAVKIFEEMEIGTFEDISGILESCFVRFFTE